MGDALTCRFADALTLEDRGAHQEPRRLRDIEDNGDASRADGTGSDAVV